MKKLVPDHKNTKKSLTTQASDLVKKNKIEIFVEYKLGENIVLSQISILTSISQLKS